jgi:ankyrin repeat protein
MGVALAAAEVEAAAAAVAPPHPPQPCSTSSSSSSGSGGGGGGGGGGGSSSSSDNTDSNNSITEGREQAERERTAAREVALALVRAGALAHCVDADSGLTPLHLAAKSAEPELVAALLAGGAHADEPCSGEVGGYTPLHFCAQHWSEPSGARAVAVARALLAAGAKAEHATAGEKLTALHLAALFADVALCKVLVEEGGAAVTAQDADGDTPLHNAAGRVSGRSGNRVPVCTYLLDHGAPLESVNRKGFTPLAVAAAAENRPEAALLVGRGAKAVTLTVTEDGEIRTADGAPLDAEEGDLQQQQQQQQGSADVDYVPRRPKKRRF